VADAHSPAGATSPVAIARASSRCVLAAGATAVTGSAGGEVNTRPRSTNAWIVPTIMSANSAVPNIASPQLPSRDAEKANSTTTPRSRQSRGTSGDEEVRTILSSPYPYVPATTGGRVTGLIDREAVALVVARAALAQA
jgi:hypothetical protein